MALPDVRLVLVMLLAVMFVETILVLVALVIVASVRTAVPAAIVAVAILVVASSVVPVAVKLLATNDPVVVALVPVALVKLRLITESKLVHNVSSTFKNEILEVEIVVVANVFVPDRFTFPEALIVFPEMFPVTVAFVIVPFVNTPFTPVIVPVAFTFVTAKSLVTVAKEIVAFGTVRPEIFKLEILAVPIFAVPTVEDAAVVVAKVEVPVETRSIVFVVLALVVDAFSASVLIVVVALIVPTFIIPAVIVEMNADTELIKFANRLVDVAFEIVALVTFAFAITAVPVAVRLVVAMLEEVAFVIVALSAVKFSTERIFAQSVERTFKLVIDEVEMVVVPRVVVAAVKL